MNRIGGLSRSPLAALVLAFALAACGGGTDPGTDGTGGVPGHAGSGGTAGHGGTAGDGGSGGTGGEGGTAGEGGSGGTAGDGGSGGIAGHGGSGGGEGGTGGTEPGCFTDDDCSVAAGAQCAVAVCNDGTYEGPVGECVVIPAAAGTACDDGLFCTLDDACNEAGGCVGGARNDCGMSDTECGSVVCDELVRDCILAPVQNGTSCTTDDLCARAVCQAGECVDVPKDCTSSGSGCGAGVCNPADGTCGLAPFAEGTSCSMAGLSQCEVAACDGAGACMPGFVPSGTACALAGLSQCETASCNGAGTCASSHRPDGTSCSDGSVCTVGDACTAGACAGTFDMPTCISSFTHYAEGFEDCASSGWTFSGIWQCGTPTSGPNGAHTGAGAIATNLSGNYVSNATFAYDTATSPVIDLGGASDPVLTFQAWMVTEECCDGFNVKVRRSGESNFTLLNSVNPPYTGAIASESAWRGTSSQWRLYSVNLSAYVGDQIELQIGFRSDGSQEHAGVYLDDVTIAESMTVPLTIGGALPVTTIAGNPLAATLTRTGGSPNVTWSITGGTNAGWLSIDGATGLVEGTPASSNAGPYSVTVRVGETGVYPNFAEKTFTGKVVDYGNYLYALDDLETTCSDWTLTGEWECGVPTLGPSTADSGTNCLATGLGRNYVNNQDWPNNTASSPPIVLPAGSQPMVTFKVWLDTELNWDGFNLNVSTDGGTTYTQLMNVSPAYTGPVHSTLQGWSGRNAALGWRDFSADLSAFAGQTVNLRFAFHSDSSNVFAGVYVDSLMVLDKAADPVIIQTSGLSNAKVGRPYAVTLQRRGGTANVTWSLVSGTNHAWLNFNPATGQLSGTPTAADSGPVQLVVRASEPAFASNYDEKTFNFDVVPVPFGEIVDEDFSSCTGWTMFPDWQCGTPTNVGPSTCRSPGGCLVTNLSGNYADNRAWATSTATWAPIDLTNAVDPKLSFWAWVRTESAGLDAFNVRISRNGGTFDLPDVAQVAPAYTGTADGQPGWGGDLTGFGWRRYTIGLSSYVGSTIQIRFAFRSDGSSNYPGIYVDDLNVSEAFREPLQITSTFLPGGFPSIPWVGQLARTGGSRNAVWSLVSGPAWLQLDPQTGRLSGTPPLFGTETVTVRVEEPLNPANFAERTLSVTISSPPTGPYHTGDFSSAGGWTVGGEWELGVATTGPGSCRAGGDCLATRLAGNYNNNAAWGTSIATSPPIDLTTAVQPRLNFWAWVRTESPTLDAFNVKISANGGPYVLPAASQVSPAYTGVANGEEGWGGDLSSWRRYTIDLGAFAGSTIQIRFAFRSDTSITDSGVYVDDLIVATPYLDPLSISTSALPDVTEGSLFSVIMQRSGGTSTASWSIASGTNHGWLSINPATGALTGTPVAANLGPVDVTIRIEQPGFPMNWAERSFTFVVEENQVGVYLDERFSNCSTWSLNPEWQCGNPNFSQGPATCRSPGGCLATNLTGLYSNNLAWATSTATSPSIDLTASTDPRLSFWVWMNTESGFDGFNVKISKNGGPFVLPTAAQVSPAYTGTVSSESCWNGDFTTSGWRKFTIDARSYAGSTIQLRFAFRSDGSGQRAGVYVDDLKIIDSFAEPLSITTAILPGGFPGVPWTASLSKSGGSTGAVWSLVSGPSWVQVDPAGRLFGTPPALGTQTVTVRVHEPLLPGNFAEATLTMDVLPKPAGPYYTGDFTSGGGWTAGGEWQMGVPTSGPGSCLLGGECLATRLAVNYNDNASWATSIATSPPIDLTAGVQTFLTFRAWVKTEGPSWDAFNVKISRDGGAFTLPAGSLVSPAYTGTANSEEGWGGDLTAFGWRKYTIDLGAYAGSSIQLRFAFRSDGSNTDAGVYVDDLQVITRGLDPLEVWTNDLPAVVPVGVPLTASFVKSGGTSLSTWTFTPVQNAGWLTWNPATRRITGTASAAQVGPVSFRVRADEPGFPGNFAEETFQFNVTTVPAGTSYFDDMEATNLWTLRGDWEFGTPSVVGPAACRSGGTCLGTKLAQDATPGLALANNYVNSPPILVPAGAPSKLTFWAWVETSNAQTFWFQAQVLRIGESTYTIPVAADVDPAYLSSATNWGGDLSQLGWRKYSIDLAAYAGQSIRVAFMLSTSGSSTLPVGPGAYVDDVAVEPASLVAPSIVEDPIANAYPNVPFTQRMKKTAGPTAVTWSITGGVNHAWLTIDPATGVLSGLPTLADIGPVSVVVRAVDPNDPTREDERELEFEVSPAAVYYATGFEGTCPNGWTLTGDWQCGVPTSGPPSAFGGTKALATNLSGNYANSRTWTSSLATSPVIDLTTASAPVAWFRMWHHMEGGTADGFHLEVSPSGGPFAVNASVSPAYRFTISSAQAWGGNHTLAGWQLVRVDLSAFTGQTVQLRFANASNSSTNFPGAYIDDLVVVEGP